MESPARKKRCQFCNKLYTPHPRLGMRQIACSDPECQKARKKANQRDWLERNPDCFKRRYANTKRWLQQHPGYLVDYRMNHPEKVARDNERRRASRRKTEAPPETSADIQDSISTQESLGEHLKSDLAAGADIQDSIFPQPSSQERLKSNLAELGSADIQDSISVQALTESFVSAYLARRRYTRLDSSQAPPPLPSSAPSAGVAPHEDL